MSPQKTTRRKFIPMPTLVEEMRLWQKGYPHVAGLDEAGRGALAGPVVAAAVIVPPQSERTGVWGQVTDSKMLSPQERSELYEEICAQALAWSIGAVGASQIDQIGIGIATRQAMLAAIAQLAIPATYSLIDWVHLPQSPLPQESFTKADQRIVSVAAASIIAKVHRDRLLVALHQVYPCYGFDRHKGYGTAAHRAAIAQHGPCSEHRHSFAPIRGSRK